MFLADYHTHSKYSFDGKETIEKMCLSAIDAGLTEIAVTDHMDIYSGKPYSYILNCPELFEELEKCRERFDGRLTLRTGIELGQPMRNRSEAELFLKDYPDLDFIIGSVHNMENDIDVGSYNFSECDCNRVCADYFDCLISLAENYDYDVIGHITYPLRYMAEAGLFPDVHRFYDRFEQLFRTVASKGRGIELNTSGFRQKLGDSMPSEDLLRLFRFCGGEIVTVGSDAHTAEHIGSEIRKGCEMLRKCGFSYISGYRGRKAFFEKLP